MRVAFDFDIFTVNKYSGLHAYGTGLLAGFSKLAVDIDAKLVYSKCFDAEISRLKVDHFDCVLRKPLPIKRRYLEKIWKHSRYPVLQWLIGSFDVYHCIYTLMPSTGSKPCIMTVHDMRRYILPELYGKFNRGRFERAFTRADHFIAVSQSTKNDLCQILGISQDKVDVIHLAADEHLSPLSQNDKNRLKAKFSEQMKTPLDRFVIAVSSSDTRKNIERTIRAFKLAVGHLPRGTKLVVTGTPPKDIADTERQKMYLSEDVVWTGPVDNLAEWLGCADALVYVSLYEGFGIPILEAFACGVPTITSDCSSMPEVAGDAAMLVDPYDEQSISQAITNVCNDEGLQKRLIRSGLERNRQFNWTKTAAKTLEVYRKML